MESPGPLPQMESFSNLIVEKSFSSRQTQSFESYSSSSYSQKYESSSKNIQKSNSMVLDKRGFKPSDRHDPRAREYLTSLSKKLWHSDENRKQKIDLQKLFTPSTDFEEIKPGKNRKLYASSAFWAPGVHPTVEDQVELARRISHSLSDISNQRSKGQSMYINRKKRSVKWVHEADGEDGNPEQTSYSYTDTSNRVNDHEERSEQTEITSNVPKKVPLKLVMNPQGHIQDFSSLQKSDTLPILSPEPIISALKVSKEKGAELFAKRRKKADKWIIDELNSEKSKPQFNNSSVSKSTTTTSSSSTTVQESYSSSTKKIDEAIETISQSFNDMTPISNTPVAEPERKQETPSTYIATSLVSQSPTIIPYPRYQGLAYRPSIAQGWNAPPIKLSIVPKYLQLFTGQQPKQEVETSKVLPEQPKSVEEEKVEAPKPVPQPQFEPVKPVTQQKPEQIQAPLPQNSNQSPYEELNIVNKLIEKHESRIKENQCDVINVPSNGYLEPVPEPTPAPEPPKPYELTIPVKRDALSNISPLPFIQNPEPLPTGISVKMPEPEPPKKPDYSYEAFLHNSPPEQYNIPPPPKALELSNLMSYNTAPRGWGAAKDYYRPVHVGQKYDNMIYSDF
uniref:CSON002456 protein n=1 Tax=Culicoides sonorensis TaxID=179676 RepID=A0A336LWR9_CULSO